MLAGEKTVVGAALPTLGRSCMPRVLVARTSGDGSGGGGRSPAASREGRPEAQAHNPIAAPTAAASQGGRASRDTVVILGRTAARRQAGLLLAFPPMVWVRMPVDPAL